jgi:hypothetical protein
VTLRQVEAYAFLIKMQKIARACNAGQINFGSMAKRYKTNVMAVEVNPAVSVLSPVEAGFRHTLAVRQGCLSAANGGCRGPVARFLRR